MATSRLKTNQSGTQVGGPQAAEIDRASQPEQSEKQVTFAEWRAVSIPPSRIMLILPLASAVLICAASSLMVYAAWIIQEMSLRSIELLQLSLEIFSAGALCALAAMIVEASLTRKRLMAFQEPQGYAVRLSITKDGAASGQDIGYLRFEEGLLFFDGLNTSFSFSNSDVFEAPIASKLGGAKLFGKGPERISFRNEQTLFQLRFLPISLLNAKLEQQFPVMLRAWATGPPHTAEISVLPPVSRGPVSLKKLKVHLIAPVVGLQLSILLLVFAWDFSLTWHYGRDGLSAHFNRISSSGIIAAVEAVFVFAMFCVVLPRRTYRQYQEARKSGRLID